MAYITVTDDIDPENTVTVDDKEKVVPAIRGWYDLEEDDDNNAIAMILDEFEDQTFRRRQGEVEWDKFGAILGLKFEIES